MLEAINIDKIIEFIKISNVLSKDNEVFLRNHLSIFDLNDNIFLSQQGRGYGYHNGRGPNFTSYYMDIEKFCEENNNFNHRYISESKYNFIWKKIFEQNDLNSFTVNDYNFTEISYNKDSFIFFDKHGIYVTIIRNDSEIYHKIFNFI